MKRHTNRLKSLYNVKTLSLVIDDDDDRYKKVNLSYI